jgi:hypothetical protein
MQLANLRVTRGICIGLVFKTSYQSPSSNKVLETVFIVSDIPYKKSRCCKRRVSLNARHISSHAVTSRGTSSSSNKASCGAKLSLGSNIHRGVRAFAVLVLEGQCSGGYLALWPLISSTCVTFLCETSISKLCRRCALQGNAMLDR